MSLVNASVCSLSSIQKGNNDALKKRIQRILKNTQKYEIKSVKDNKDYCVRAKVSLFSTGCKTTIIGYDYDFDIIPSVQNVCEEMRDKSEEYCSIPEISVSPQKINKRKFVIQEQTY